MRTLIAALTLGILGVAIVGCQAESGSAEYSSQVSKEMPKPKDTRDDLPPPPGIKLNPDKGGGMGAAKSESK